MLCLLSSQLYPVTMDVIFIDIHIGNGTVIRIRLHTILILKIVADNGIGLISSIAGTPTVGVGKDVACQVSKVDVLQATIVK